MFVPVCSVRYLVLDSRAREKDRLLSFVYVGKFLDLGDAAFVEPPFRKYDGTVHPSKKRSSGANTQGSHRATTFVGTCTDRSTRDRYVSHTGARYQISLSPCLSGNILEISIEINIDYMFTDRVVHDTRRYSKKEDRSHSAMRKDLPSNNRRIWCSS